MGHISKVGTMPRWYSLRAEIGEQWNGISLLSTVISLETVRKHIQRYTLHVEDKPERLNYESGIHLTHTVYKMQKLIFPPVRALPPTPSCPRVYAPRQK